MTHSVLISGLGRIGALADLSKGSRQPVTHLGCVLATPGLKVSGLVEPDAEHLYSVLLHWPELAQVQTFSSLADAPNGVADLIILAGPVTVRGGDFDEAARISPKLIILEKPIAGSLDEARSIAKHAEKLNLETRINFHRRLDSAHQVVRQSLPVGQPRGLVVRYSHGLHHFASHAIDLLADWFGPFNTVMATGRLDDKEAVSGDKLYSFNARFAEGGSADFIAMPRLDYPVFEIEFYYTDRRVVLEQGGVRMFAQKTDSGRVYTGYPILAPAQDLVEPNRPVGGFAELYVAAAKHLTEGAPMPGCTVAEAVAGMQVLDAVERSWDACGEITLN